MLKLSRKVSRISSLEAVSRDDLAPSAARRDICASGVSACSGRFQRSRRLRRLVASLTHPHESDACPRCNSLVYETCATRRTPPVDSRHGHFDLDATERTAPSQDATGESVLRFWPITAQLAAAA